MPDTQGTHSTSSISEGGMRPPPGFASELYPLRHKLLYSFGLSCITASQNSAFITIIRNTSDVITNTPKSIVVNPHNTLYVSDAGPAVQKMSIIDKLSLSLRFNLTEHVADKRETSAGTFTGDTIHHLRMLWRPVFFSFPEKLDAADDDTGTTVAAILGLTKDATFEDVVPLTTTKLPVQGVSDLSQPVSTVNIAEVFGDYNMTTDTTMEDHPWDETLFQDAIRRYTNKGALKACVGRTRHVNLTRERPFKNFFIDKFVPRSIRRIMPYSFMGIQINLPIISDIGQDYFADNPATSKAQVGVKCIINYHEWNADHYQDMTGAAPLPP